MWEKLTKEQETMYSLALDQVKSIEIQLYSTIKFMADIKMEPERIKSIAEITNSIGSLKRYIQSDLEHSRERK